MSTDYLTAMSDPNMSKEAAIAIEGSGWWKLYTPREVALAQLRQDRLCMPFGDFHEAVENAVGGSVWTHEFAGREALIARIEAGKQGARSPFASLADVKLRRSRSGLYAVRGTGRRYRTKALALRSCTVARTTACEARSCGSPRSMARTTTRRASAMGDDKPTNVHVTCDHPGCGATARLDTPGWQISAFGERCPEHRIELQPVPPRPRKVVAHHEPPRPSTWLPPGPDDAPVLHVGPSAAREMLEAAARGATSGLSAVVQELHEPADFGLVPECEEPGCEGVGEVIDGTRIVCREHAPKVDDATIDLELFEAPMYDHPLSREDIDTLESIKAAVRRKLGEE